MFVHVTYDGLLICATANHRCHIMARPLRHRIVVAPVIFRCASGIAARSYFCRGRQFLGRLAVFTWRNKADP